MTTRVQKPDLYPKTALSEVDSHEKFEHKQDAMTEQVEMRSMNEWLLRRFDVEMTYIWKNQYSLIFI